MNPNEKTMLRSPVAVAWADGQVEEPEQGVLEEDRSRCPWGRPRYGIHSSPTVVRYWM